MAVPGEDQRDWDFARQHGLPIIETVKRPAGWVGEAYGGDGIKINSGFLDGLTVAEAKRKAIDWLVERGLGVAKINFRLRDWGISRQRYWGAPIPVLYCERCGMVPEKEENLPVVLPRNVQISGKGGSPLAEAAGFVNAPCPRCGGKARRETDTIDTFVADTARLFSLFAAPPEKDLDWNDHGVEGGSRFLNRIWRFVLAHLDEIRSGAAVEPLSGATRAGRAVGGDVSPLPTPIDQGKALRRVIHETIARVTADIERDFHFNTAVSAIMELVKALYAFEQSSLHGMPRAVRAGLLRA